MSKELEGRTAIVTGGGSGLGAASCLSMAKKGANVIVNYASSEDGAKDIAQRCRDMGVGAEVVQASVAEDAGCRRIVEAAGDAFGRVDILINNAGITKFADHNDLDALNAEDFTNLYGVNVVGVYQMARAARTMLEASGKGSIVNISSYAGVTGSGSSIAYCASKGALNTMTLSLARALAPRIRINAVCPGYISSGWFTKYQGESTEDRAAEYSRRNTPLQAASTPEDIVGAVDFFACDGSAHVTGEFIMIDAGLHLGTAPLKAR